jgi:hypothetical protein
MSNIPTSSRSSGGHIPAKLASIVGFLTLVASTYYLRGEVLALSQIRFSADEVRANYELDQLRESFPDMVEQHEAAMVQYDLQMEHYREMLALYRSDYDAYVQRIADEFQPPQMPYPPTKPRPPEVAEQLHEIDTAFRARKSTYFKRTSLLNWVAAGAALLLVGGLTWLLMFDTDSPRWHYLVALGLSFVFLIGPSFHSILTGIIGFMENPGVY